MNKLFEERQAEYVSMVNRALERYLPEDNGPYGVVRQAMRYSAGAGGKRIRPLLTLECARLFGGRPEEALPLACAVEMVHTYSLIHDDLPCMDNDDMRRGKPSCHKQFGEANALLAGDGLLTLAFELIGSAPELAGTSPLAALKACRILAKCAGVDGMVGGQVMDLINEENPVEEDTLLETYRLKTSALLEAACCMGACAAGADESAVKAAGSYARKLGVAFQIVDDILDVTGDEKTLGKPVGSDAESGKTTFVTLRSLAEAKAKAEQLTGEALAAVGNLTAENPENGDFLRELTRRLLIREY